MTEGKLTSFRWSDQLASNARLVAQVDGVSVNTLIGNAIASYIADRRADCEFRDRLRRRIEAEQQLLARLAAGEKQ